MYLCTCVLILLAWERNQQRKICVYIHLFCFRGLRGSSSASSVGEGGLSAADNLRMYDTIFEKGDLVGVTV